MLFPNSKSVFVLDARFITLLKSYSLLGSGNCVMPDWSVRLLIDIVPVGSSILPTTPVATFDSSFLNNISIVSPTFKLDLSISLVNTTTFAPDILSTLNLDEVLYIHELAKICFLDLSSSGFNIFSPTFLTLIFSPSTNNLISEVGTNFDKTPVSLNSTFFVKSPPSYPK